jgi:hypothetical protein
MSVIQKLVLRHMDTEMNGQDDELDTPSGWPLILSLTPPLIGTLTRIFTLIVYLT